MTTPGAAEPRRGFSTRAVHDGQGPDPTTGAVVQPIHLATTFAQDGVGGLRAGFEYSRAGNPTRAALEQCLASLEGARHTYAFASGLAATTTLMLLLEAGDHVVYMEDGYGGSARLFNDVLRRFGLDFTAVDATQPAAVERAMTPKTKMVWLESPTNPLLRVVDIAAVCDVAHAGGAVVCVDNTFASPYLQQPIALGADLVMHSATKYLGGHSDVVGGAVMVSDDALGERLLFHQNALGGVPSPFDCWLLLRGIKTLALRMERQCESALSLAQFLDGHDAVTHVNYPGLPGHPGHALAKRQMSGRFGGMISFEVASAPRALQVLDRLTLFTLAESLGAVESLAEHPALMTHASVPPEERERIGITDGLIRLSVGIEDLDDLREDLERALG